AKEMLQEKFDSVDFESEKLSFTYTDYYNKEIGDNLIRRFISFKELQDPGELCSIKILTNEIEQKFLYENTKNRRINIDPGLLSLSKFILATTKNYSHRIYIGDGIFAEVTLKYENKGFVAFDWTYPDYKTEEYRTILNRIREIYKEQIKTMMDKK
ncbi:MAG: DUF4416 family protein, partial [Candidatus Goldbacteria bacterium]|nr:DUF4416 family protein [Candidatus Goldiibacteriota bacterium]